METFEMTPKDILDSKTRGEEFLFRVIEEKFEGTVETVRKRREKDIDAEIDEIIDWPIRLEAYAYLGNKHKELVPKLSQELRALWDTWISLMEESDVPDKRVFWPITDVESVPINPFVLQELRANGTASFWEAPDAAIECHVAMFRVKETLGIGGYERYFNNAREMMGNLLINKHLFDDSTNRRILWQISRSPSLRNGLKEQMRLVAPQIKKIIAEQAEEVSDMIRTIKDEGIDDPDALVGKRMYDVDFWAEIGFFLALNDLGKEMNDLVKMHAENLIDQKYPNAGFHDRVDTTCLALSMLKLVDADPSMSASISALGWLLKQQSDEGFWTAENLSDRPFGHVDNIIFKDALIPYKVLPTVMVLETIDLVRNLQPLPIWSPRGGSSIFRRDSRLQAIVPFPTPEGATWDMVRIRILSSKEAAELRIGDVQEGRDYEGMGFMDRRRTKEKRPDVIWDLLIFLGQGHRQIDFQTEGLPFRRENVKAYIKDLRKRLIHLFQIKDDPFEEYRKVKAYKPKFTIEITVGAYEEESDV
ncbi:MAG: hypothetical protein ABSG73_13255 [Candidatus Aminicenantales bacterium]|jgi:hypothetical protein